jgi:biopolymer transport protein ExbD
MAASTALGEDDIVSGINVTPLVDITLVLLIIFMVTAKLIAQQGIPMDLPKAASAGAVQSVLTVSVDKDGHVFANGQALRNDAELRSIAKGALSANPETRTVIQAAGAASHASVLHTMDELRESGVTKIAFAAEKASRALDIVPAP